METEKPHRYNIRDLNSFHDSLYFSKNIKYSNKSNNISSENK